MALTDAHKAAIRLYAGWPARFHQLDSRLENAMASIADVPEHEAQLTNAITGSPPGLLALLADLDLRLTAAQSRLKAERVGSLILNGSEMASLRGEGRRLVNRMLTILGVPRGADVFSGGGGPSAAYVGK